MTWEWKIGNPVDDANGGTMDAQIGMVIIILRKTIVMRAE